MPQITVSVREPTGKLDEKTNEPKYAPKTYTYTVTNRQHDFYHQWTNYLALRNIDLEPKAEQQVHDMIKKNDFALLHALTDVIRKAKGDTPEVAITADLNVHKVGIWRVSDFPYLNKNRLGSTNRGLYRLCFDDALGVFRGIFDEHEQTLTAWRNEGIKNNTAK